MTIITTTITNDYCVKAIEWLMDKLVPDRIYFSDDTVPVISEYQSRVHMYKSNIWLIYDIGGRSYFDIAHLIANLTENVNAYHNLKYSLDLDMIPTMIIITKNLTGEIIRRELINCSTMARIVMSSDSIFGRNFVEECCFTLMFLYLFLWICLVTIMIISFCFN